VLKFEKRYKIRLRKIRVVSISFWFLKKLHLSSTTVTKPHHHIQFKNYHFLNSRVGRSIIFNPN
jgi:hypothetical protein